MRHLVITPAGGSHANISRRIKRMGLDTHHVTDQAHDRGWALEPGDVVFFHMLTAHHAYGVPGAQRRRAFSLRFLGDDATHAPRPWRTSRSSTGWRTSCPRAHLRTTRSSPSCGPADEAAT